MYNNLCLTQFDKKSIWNVITLTPRFDSLYKNHQKLPFDLFLMNIFLNNEYKIFETIFLKTVKILKMKLFDNNNFEP